MHTRMERSTGEHCPSDRAEEGAVQKQNKEAAAV
jgi:hypothetical protein